MKVAAVQMQAVVGQKAENCDKGIAYAEQAAQDGAKLICLPELFNTGYFSHTSHVDVEYFQLAEPIEGKTVAAFQKLAKSFGTYLVVPFFEREAPGIYYNSACVLNVEGEVLGVYRKAHIPWSHTGWEKFYMRPGSAFPVFPTTFGRIGIMICYDRDFPEVARSLSLQGAELILVPNGAPSSSTQMWERIMQVRAYENQVFLLGACLTGKADAKHHEFTGHSLLVNPYGSIEQVLGREEGVLVQEIDFTQVEAARSRRFLYRDRRPEIYTQLVKF